MKQVPVRSLKAAGLSWSMEASTSMGVRHFWQYSPDPFLSLAMLLWMASLHASEEDVKHFQVLQEA